MITSNRDPHQLEIDRLRAALDAETERCQDLQRRLDRAASECEEFMSTAAHNMREPLRDVAAFSQLLAETRCRPPRCRRRCSASPAFSKVPSGWNPYLRTWWTIGPRLPPNPWARQLKWKPSCSRPSFPSGAWITERNAIITHSPLPLVMGNFDLLAKVLRHLISNAIQYCAVPVPRIHISAKRLELAWAFSVADNGPGIEPAFHSRVFGAFKRLHGREFPGNGLGLAYCTKAIEGLGGRIWVESAAGEGATFCFTLPPAD